MRKLLISFVTVAILSGCQTAEDGLTTSSTPTTVTGPAASAIAGDMASRLAEQIGPSATTTIKIEKDSSDFASALEAALKGWGYTVVTDGKVGRVGKDVKLVELGYSIDGVDGQVLARLSTPSIALGRAYSATAAGAVPASPLSIMQRN
ncbi:MULTISPECIES: conjugal transfer protein TrbH [Sinorhizobium/Ensifer group]|uniref:Conjugal transfer protein TrbH n=4 Tax=Sinorhizobium TaxID=28105 RepID=A0A844ADW3_RHIFR|nr:MULTISPECIES: conjugal transfer protein TrbH [Sinorhizobium]MCK3781252.1 conjugal transfer protein TrbH [Ensifer sesbaniae]AFL55196.1 putative conjugal transfer protein TrbH [Sinorhizobium fredii USDA 257]ASY61338.1 Conjugative transfer protein TrbH [Sinorhizobium sp. CCBAU 05631]ASY67435.1 Conjugative transfer protein TrbH [Sinorhizobium sojae CCBAU 05684]ASY74303.1 Conjugative transfer protein TrbH [Sinorhizobium fredii CCBAU 83666]